MCSFRQFRWNYWINKRCPRKKNSRRKTIHFYVKRKILAQSKDLFDFSSIASWYNFINSFQFFICIPHYTRTFALLRNWISPIIRKKKIQRFIKLSVYKTVASGTPSPNFREENVPWINFLLFIQRYEIMNVNSNSRFASTYLLYHIDVQY